MFAFVDGFRGVLVVRNGVVTERLSCFPMKVGLFVNPIVPRRPVGQAERRRAPGHGYLRSGPNLISGHRRAA